ncbi:hypothetical protein AKJ18_30180, partial [Vibrio xuii]
MLKLLPIRVEPQPEGEQAPSDVMDKLGDLVVKYRQWLLPSSVLVIAATAALIPLNRVNDESVKYFATSSEFRQAADFIEANISGMTNISIAVKTNESQGIADPEFLKTISDFTGWLRNQPETDHVASLSD